VTFCRNAIGLTLFLVFSGMALIGQSSDATIHYQELVPLGATAFAINGSTWHGTLSLLGSAESVQFNGMTARGPEHQRALFTAAGQRIANYPGRVAFRVTATFRRPLLDPDPFPVKTSEEENSYLLGLRFRLVVFHGLRQKVIAPASVEMIGVPPEMPYDERIYRIVADLGEIPVLDRIVLEVHSPDGARLCKFHLDLM
jgi:hypothetical protein